MAVTIAYLAPKHQTQDGIFVLSPFREDIEKQQLLHHIFDWFRLISFPFFFFHQVKQAVSDNFFLFFQIKKWHEYFPPHLIPAPTCCWKWLYMAGNKLVSVIPTDIRFKVFSMLFCFIAHLGGLYCPPPPALFGMRLQS